MNDLTWNNSTWYKPTFSPEQGVLLVLFGAFLTGSALSVSWTYTTTIALICTFFALQAEYPIVVQIKQRKTLKPRFLIWGFIYGSIALSLGIWLCVSLNSPVLLWIYGGVIIALIIDAIAVWHRQQKGIANELVSFAAVCLASPFAYAVNTGEISLAAISMWLLNTLFYASAIFTIKLRKKKTSSLMPGLIYHCLASLIIVGLYWLNLLSFFTALAFFIAILKLFVITWQLKWYQTARFWFIARFETYFALTFIAIASISVLPPHLNNI